MCDLVGDGETLSVGVVISVHPRNPVPAVHFQVTGEIVIHGFSTTSTPRNSATAKTLSGMVSSPASRRRFRSFSSVSVGLAVASWGCGVFFLITAIRLSPGLVLAVAAGRDRQHLHPPSNHQLHRPYPDASLGDDVCCPLLAQVSP